MCVSYIAAGLPCERFWDLTPRLYLIEMEGARGRLEREQKDRLEGAWYGELLRRQKKLPKLEKLLAGDPPPKSKEELQAALSAIRERLPAITLEHYLERKRTWPTA